MENTAEYIPPELIKEDYRDFLSKTGVIEAFIKVLTQMFNEAISPTKPLDYIRKYFGNASGEDIKILKEELTTLQEENSKLKDLVLTLSNENDKLRDEILGAFLFTCNYRSRTIARRPLNMWHKLQSNTEFTL
eukprot:snap_masked-scaffold_32-processed-gene-2.34-mRNA-1 protein AED:1.00 eAED:1.00 QI:0/0/0/0/1/1/3/0/132